MSDFALWEASAQAWLDTVEKDSNRVLLLDPVMVDLCDPIPQKFCLDVGSGEGRFARMLSKKGAEVVCLDPIERFASVARGILGSGDALPIHHEQFDLVVAYLVLCDIGNYRAAIAEWARVLKTGGHLVIADIHPMFGNEPWVRDAQGNKTHRLITNYFSEEGEVVEWSGIRVKNYRRPFTSIFDAMKSNNLVLDVFLEPTPTDEAIARDPRLADDHVVPNFWVSRWKKQ